MAHRGASFHAPENTRTAFLKAYELAADGIETDLQLTADGEIVIHHNYYIDNTSNGRGAIALMRTEELKQYDFGSYKDAAFAGERILTLQELLPILKDSLEGQILYNTIYSGVWCKYTLIKAKRDKRREAEKRHA